MPNRIIQRIGYNNKKVYVREKVPNGIILDKIANRRRHGHIFAGDHVLRKRV
jgi:hypothetical protein